MADETAEIDFESQCRWCRKALYDWPEGEERVDIYELTHHWGIQRMERATPESPKYMTDFVGEPFKLLGKFCSAACLVAYVRERIEPDEREQESE